MITISKENKKLLNELSRADDPIAKKVIRVLDFLEYRFRETPVIDIKNIDYYGINVITINKGKWQGILSFESDCIDTRIKHINSDKLHYISSIPDFVYCRVHCYNTEDLKEFVETFNLL